MIDLAVYSEKEPVSIQSIADRQNISERYLEQLMASLKKEGLVKSIRGANGGYQLARPAIGISVGDILRALEGDLRAVTCPANGEEGNGGCENADLCVTRYVWQRINEGITHAVDTMYLNQLVEESKKLKEKGTGTACRLSGIGGKIIMKKIIYLDNAATTKVAPEVVEAMLPYFTEYYGNPSSVYELAGISKKAVTEGREKVASVIGANPNDIYFTAGGSESDNWALKATYEAYKSKGNHIITTKIEHHAILHTCEWLEKQGAKITYIDVDENGVVDLDQLQKAITPETILISVMAANNEIGTCSQSKKSVRSHKNTVFYSIPTLYRHLVRSRSM